MKETCWKSPSSQRVYSPATPGEADACAKEAPAVYSSCSNIAILIPAYKPGPVLVELVRALCEGGWRAIVIVDDGSGPAYRPIFVTAASAPSVEVIPHAVNLGKGSALKAGVNFILCTYPEIAGIVTVDADGQHDPRDVTRVCEKFHETPHALVLGVRDFRGDIPLRSKLGNRITRSVMRAVVGHDLSDSQTGLRAIPRVLLPRLLKVAAPGYEFELEMLIAVKHLGLEIVEQPIRTIYEPGNPTSHFQPLRDSMRIYFVLLRFTMIGILSAMLDNAVFYLLYRLTGNILESQIGARIVSMLFNYAAVRRAAFLSEEQHRVTLPRYLVVVAANAALSYAGIALLTGFFSIGVLPAKILTEGLLFIGSFLVQRDFVFTRRA